MRGQYGKNTLQSKYNRRASWKDLRPLEIQRVGRGRLLFEIVFRLKSSKSLTLIRPTAKEDEWLLRVLWEVLTYGKHHSTFPSKALITVRHLNIMC